MNITKLNEVIAAAARHGLLLELKPDGNHVTVNRPTGYGALISICTHARPDVALEAIQRAVTPQPEKWLTLDEAIKNSGHPAPWRVVQEGTRTRVFDEDGAEVSSSDPADYEDHGLSEENAILAAHCVTQLPRLVEVLDEFLDGFLDDISVDLDPLRHTLAAAKRVPGKVVAP